MKYTGLAVILIGACILMFCLVAAVTTGQPAGSAADVASSKFDLVFPIIMGVVALATGMVMYAFGGRGYISTRNPAIRN
jgi:hypothetical protein